MAQSDFIPFHRPSIGNEEVRAVAKVLRSGWLTTGAVTAEFERGFGDYVKSDCALALNSCTAALHIALAALDIGEGDEVITTPLTFCATVNSILHVGATPVLADVNQDGNIDPASIEARITPRTRAIIPVHLAGLPCAMDEIWEIAARHGLHVIEDAAHAAGTHYRGSPIGTSRGMTASTAVAFSFYATKNLTTGEGGMLTTGDSALYERCRRLALHGISKDAWNRYTEKGSWAYDVTECGFKYNLSDIQSAIGVQQLRKLESFIATRERWAALYAERFRGMAELEAAPVCSFGRHSWHLYVLRLNLGDLTIDRDEFMVELKRRGVGGSVHFIPIPQLSFFSRWAQLSENQCPKASELYRRSVSLPLYPAMTEAEVERVAATVTSIAQQHRRHVWAIRASGD